MKRILVAEDNDSNYLLVTVILRGKYDIERANNGKEAVEKMQTGTYDYVLMDIRMPIMDGLEATKHIREFNSCTPIIAVSAYAFESDKRNAMQSGFNNYLEKPIDKKRLLSLLEE